MRNLMKKNIECKSLYVKSGLLEPVQLDKEERDLLVSGIEELMSICIKEIETAQKKYSK